MPGPDRLLTRLVGGSVALILIAAGVVGCYNLVANPDARLGGGTLEPLLVLGPLLLLGGAILLALVSRRGPPIESALTDRLLWVGLTMVAVPGALLLAAEAGNHEVLGLAGTLGLIALGIPGLFLIGFSVAQRFARRAP